MSVASTILGVGSDLPVNTTDDVLAVLPAFLRSDDPKPVRDALIAALTEIMLRYQVASGYAASQSDILYATGNYLAALATDLGVVPQSGETDAEIRARAIRITELVTPRAILAAVNTILEPVTAIRAQYMESVLDRFYCFSGSGSYHSFVGASPSYPDRLYPDDIVANGGDVRPQSNPGGMWTFPDTIGRYFILRVPVLVTLNSTFTSGTSPDISMYTGTGSTTVAAFIYENGQLNDAVYQSIISSVERIKGAGIRWMMLIDPKLVS